MSAPEIRFCLSNWRNGSHRLWDLLASKSREPNIRLEPCLGYCSSCIKGSFALLGKVKIEAETPKELAERILANPGFINPEGREGKKESEPDR
ncbi:DUF1450 domain-containing protein [Staphylospora marina]|uniref:DUF1450 domain-containing protein n=1 Tax=Staphylospora marina TaxID=2490858 RepID=UPI0013DE128A